MDAPIHPVVGDYELVSLLGSGGMGRVYLARHRHWETSLAAFERDAELFWQAATLNELGEVHRARGELQAAATAYARSARLMQLLDNPQEVIPRVNSCLVALEAGRPEGAWRLVQEAMGSKWMGFARPIRLGLRIIAVRAALTTAAQRVGPAVQALLDELRPPVCAAADALALLDDVVGDLIEHGHHDTALAVVTAAGPWFAVGEFDGLDLLQARVADLPILGPPPPRHA